MSITAPSARRLTIETLENKEPLAGNVTAIIAGSSLDISGDALGNEIRVEEVAQYDFLVTGVNGTTVNGSPQVLFTLPSPNPELRVDLKGGDDVLRLKNISSLDKIGVDTGDGLDKVLLNGVQLGWGNSSQVYIHTGAGDDLLNSKNSSAGLFSARMGGGDDKVFLKETYTDTLEVLSQAGDDRIGIGFYNPRTLYVRAGVGDDVVRLFALQAGHSEVYTGDGADKVKIHGFVGGHLSVDTGGEKDRVDIRSGVYHSVLVQTGDHDDVVTVKPGSFPWISGGATISELYVHTQANADRVVLDSVDADRSYIISGLDGDKVKILNSTFHTGLHIQLGSGGDNWLKTTNTQCGYLVVVGGDGKDRVLLDTVDVTNNPLEVYLADGNDFFAVDNSDSLMVPIFDGGDHFDTFVVSGLTNNWVQAASTYSTNFEQFM